MVDEMHHRFGDFASGLPVLWSPSSQKIRPVTAHGACAAGAADRAVCFDLAAANHKKSRGARGGQTRKKRQTRNTTGSWLEAPPDATSHGTRMQPPEQAMILSEAIEDERRLWARDIHDLSGQYIVPMLLRLGTLERHVDDPLLQAQFAEFRQTLTQFSAALEELTAPRRAATSDGHRIVEALAGLVEAWGQRVGIRTEFRSRSDDKISIGDAVAEALTRIVQEALTNVAKHSTQATSVSVEIRLHHSGLLLKVEDNGAKISLSAHDRVKLPGRQSGISGILQRIAELGGDVSFRLRSDKGLRLIVVIRPSVFAGQQ